MQYCQEILQHDLPVKFSTPTGIAEEETTKFHNINAMPVATATTTRHKKQQKETPPTSAMYALILHSASPIWRWKKS